MVLKNLFSGQQWRNRHREQTYGRRERGGEGEIYGKSNMETYYGGLVTKSCPTLAIPWSLLGSSVHGILQVRILGWLVMASSGGSSQPRDKTQVSHIVGGFFTD